MRNNILETASNLWSCLASLYITLFQAGSPHRSHRFVSASAVVSLADQKQFENSLDVIMFLTDGQPNDKISDIQNVIKANNQKMNHTVRIFFYGLGDDFGTLTSAKQYDLMTLADQNNMNLRNYQYKNLTTGQSFTIHPNKWKGQSKPVGKPGHFEIIDSSEAKDLRQIMGKYYLLYKPPFSRKPSFRLPSVDPHSGQLLVTASVPLMLGNTLIGVTAIDVRFTSLFTDVSRYKVGAYSYAFLVTREGKVLSHRNFVKPSRQHPDINFVELDLAEPVLDNATIKDITENAGTGSFKAQVPLSISRGLSQLDGSYKLMLNATYYYRPVRLFEDQYSVVVVIFDEDRQYLKTQYLDNHKNATQGNSAIYHRLDLLPPQASSSNPSVCVTPFSVVKATSSVISTIKLSPNAFIDPDNYLNKKETVQYVKDLNNILTGVNNNTALLPEAMEEIKYTKGFEQLPSSNVLTSRYLATNGGVFRITPGMVLGQGYDATDQPWFRQSSLYQDKCVITRPGYSPTGDQTLASISQALHTPQGAMIGAVGGDVPVTYLRTLVETTIPACTLPDMKCYLLDHSGYLVTEYGTPIGSGTRLYHKHIAELEPEIMADIQNWHTAVQAKWCLQPGTKKQSQMFYDFSLTYTPLVSLPSSCVNYTLHPINGTNLHCLAASNISSCNKNTNTPSCVCSQTCASCVNVNVTCQCPCECMVGVDPCTNRYSKQFPPISCPAPWEPTKSPKLNMTLTPCPLDCHHRLNQSSCLSNGGGCQWCNLFQGGTCLKSCPSPITTTTLSTTTTQASCPIGNQTYSIRVFSNQPPSSYCPISSKTFCDMHCITQPTCPPPNDEKYTTLAAGLGAALAALSVLSLAGAGLLLRRRKVPTAISEPATIKPVEPFNTNIHRASMGDDLMSSIGRRGAQINDWNSNGLDIFGRRVSTVSHS
ncbi:VWFA and cache domain-containing protein 1-like [Watersipora subatra]|uniref:VWFA and cache domain-containing protein 1-like n=1 Tax=Watersipora subatra TaxID=2589382 RepID=UPI00355BF5F4